MHNIFIRTDPAGNIKMDKEKSTEKIDGAIATVMALDRAIRCSNDTAESVYIDLWEQRSDLSSSGAAGQIPPLVWDFYSLHKFSGVRTYRRTAELSIY